MVRHAIMVALSLLLFVSGASNPLVSQETRRYIEPRTITDTAAGPFSAGVLVGNTLYLAGKIGLTAERRVPASAAEEARLVLNDVKATLESAGMSMDDLVSVQVFCSDLSQYDTFNRVYRTYFKKEFPARAFIGSGPLLFGAKFEVQGIAVRR